MLRLPRLTGRFLKRREALGLTSGPAALAVARTIVALARGPLPGAEDAETLMPPVARYWFRRVPGHNLWVFFAFGETELVMAASSRYRITAAEGFNMTASQLGVLAHHERRETDLLIPWSRIDTCDVLSDEDEGEPHLKIVPDASGRATKAPTSPARPAS